MGAFRSVELKPWMMMTFLFPGSHPPYRRDFGDLISICFRWGFFLKTVKKQNLCLKKSFFVSYEISGLSPVCPLRNSEFESLKVS